MSLLGKNNGFTLVEVIVVIVLMAIFATMAVSRQPHTDMTLRAGAEVLKTHLRYAQMRAMSTDNAWGISYNSTSGAYWLFPQPQGTTRRITLPGETQNSVDLVSSGVSSAEGTFTLIFDPRGRPDTTNSTLPFNARQATLTLSKSGESQTITVMENTGFIQ
ncbi:MAG: prepilin-type N-terminal cleavage/methylation domain-containing protein [Desulfobacterales bacterium]|nr:prepilin-type N-terminal cleavage/methylation domain-containing protein [Desulfobacterales bacterium]